MADFDIEQIKDANPIDEVIEEITGWQFERGFGEYVHCKEHDSLVVMPSRGKYHWNSRDWHGDVISFLEQYKGWTFVDAVEYLCKRAGLPEPDWGKSLEKIKQVRHLEDVLDVAQQVFVEWLWKDEAALRYARSRGWSDHTIRETNIGFSGRHQGRYEDMRETLRLHQYNPDHPACVAVTGFRGDVRGWAQHWEVSLPEKYKEAGYIPGMMGRPGLVYPHIRGGRIRYQTRRNLPGFDKGKDGKVRKSFNLLRALAGERQPYFNHVYTPNAEVCIIVEGPGDAVSLGQLGFPAVALIGVTTRDPVMQHLARALKRHKFLYLGLDNDPAGTKNTWKVAEFLGPLTRLVDWSVMGA